VEINSKKLWALLTPAIIVVALDQWSKYLVRTTPSYQNWEIIDGWLSFHYTQNPGMAMGMDWASTEVISVIAIIATIVIVTYILRSMHQANMGYMTCMGLIIGGALGNIIDRLFMARIQNYGGVLEGHVVDFIHFTLQINGYPVFPYIFNVADIAISTSIITLLVFNKRLLPIEEEENDSGSGNHSENDQWIASSS
jgi:signal peptidase II